MKRFFLLLLLLPVIFLLDSKIEADNFDNLTIKLRERVGEPDSNSSIFSDAQALRWLNQSQDKVARITGQVQKHTDLIYTVDSLRWMLPTDFRDVLGIVVSGEDRWRPVLHNPYFTFDTSVPTYFIGREKEDTTHIYFRGGRLTHDDDTIRIFYRGSPSIPADSSAECDLDDDLEVFVIDEAVLYYLQYKSLYQEKAAQWNENRLDMGVRQNANP